MSYRFLPWPPTTSDPRFEGVRLLVLGESHYEEVSEEREFRDVDAEPTHTHEMVIRWGSRPEEGRQVFFANLYTVLSGKPWAPDDPELEAFWNSIFFYNYVQKLVPGGARHAPSASMWTDAEKPFRAVLEEINPDAVLVLGQRLWDNMAKQDQDLGYHSDGLGLICGYQLKGGRVVPAAHTKHPSSPGFAPLNWHKPVRNFLEWIKSQVQR